MTICRGLPAVLLMTWLVAAPASAQTSQGAIASGAISATAADSKTSLSFSASAGYRFNRAMGLTIEFASAPSIESESSRIDVTLLQSFGAFGLDRLAAPGFERSDDSGSLTSFTVNVRLEMPTTSRHVLPYAVAGGGVANVKESFNVFYALPAATASVIGIPVPIPPINRSFTESSTDLALTLGGGVSLLKGDHLSFDIDLRYLRLLGNEDRDIGRFGGGVSYRF